ncbi:MAG: Brp/Blh family beta-carotene 15,15'-dioxygenase [Porticoccaceae bacterium]|nr:Brp/Blh family beta-carotene 15,15'-dioxygenase [Porticoccaceae bacterium]
MTSWDLAAIAAVLIIGVPHGGLDGAVARRIGWSKGLVPWLGFHLSYIALAALVVWLWLQWPVPGLAVFLLISALHFGRSDIAYTQSLIASNSAQQWLPLIAHGGLVSIAIPSLQSAAVQPVFTILVGDEGAALLIKAIGMLFLPWLLSLAGYAIYAIMHPLWRRPLLSLISLVILALVLPPLISFALYFCLWHSRSHTLLIWQSFEENTERRRSFIEATVYSLMAWTAALGFFMVFQGSLSSALIQLTFIGLAALTVPHMLLVDIADKLKQQRLLP